MSDDSDWSPELILHNNTIWFPLLQVAWQALSHLSSTWVAFSMDTAAVILLSHIFSRMQTKVNKHITLVSVIKGVMISIVIGAYTYLCVSFILIPTLVWYWPAKGTH
eukprot:9717893-Ditylum_brightwellii.AAC.1